MLALYIILGILVAVIGVVMLVNPKLIYDITESWKSDGATEPSKRFILETRLGGVLFLLVGIGGTVILLFFR